MSPARRPSGAPRGYYGVAVWHPKTEANVGSLWRTAHTYGASFLATVGRRYEPQASDTTQARRSVPLHHYTDLDDLLAHIPDQCPLVGIELDDRARPLDEWSHPHCALYLLGAEDHGLSPAVLARCQQVVSIPAPQPRSINVAVAGSIVIADRYMRHRARCRELGAVPA